MPNERNRITSELESFRPFDYGDRQSDLMTAISARLSATVQQQRRKMISDENAHSYRHGREWSVTRAHEDQEFSQFHTVSSTVTIPFRDLTDHRTDAVGQYIEKIASDFNAGFMKNIYELMNTTTEKTGNVTVGSGDVANDILDMLSKIELGCDRHGRPSMPLLHVSPEQGLKITGILNSQSPDFERRLNEIQSQKEKAAIEHEVDRIGRFRW